MILEIAVFSVEAALNAISAGADRIEFCENPNEGGTTPSYGSLKTLIALTTIPVFPIIRPRGGDFLYTEAEYACIKADLLLVKEILNRKVKLHGISPDFLKNLKAIKKEYGIEEGK